MEHDHFGMEDIIPTTAQSTKLFVGQIPKDITEEILSTYFEEFGSIKELSVIRDTATGLSRGCAFVTYFERTAAEKAVEQLHDKVKLPNAINFLQVRFAETQVEKENKLFVGMLPKTFTENDLHQMFIAYGELKEVHIIRGPEGSPKGCAFVKFVDRDAATNAINALNETIPNGATRPLVVKFADSKKLGGKDDGSGNAFPHQGGIGNKPDPWFGVPQGPPVGLSGQFMVDASGQLSPAPPRAMYPFSLPSPVSPMNQHPQVMSPYLQHRPTLAPPNSGYHLADPNRMNPLGFPGQQSFNNMQTRQQMDSMQQQRNMQSSSPQDSDQGHTRPPEGPVGANLFIYHLPRDLTDADLATLFAPFGNVISAKVFVDKKTSDSKGFGFVSYETFESANSAIESMNGFQIGSKRLKVQHKRLGGQPGNGGGMVGNNMQMMGGMPDHMMAPRSVMLHHHHHQHPQSSLGNPMMSKLGGHDLSGINPFGNTTNNHRFDYGASQGQPGQPSGNPNGGMPTPYHVMQQQQQQQAMSNNNNNRGNNNGGGNTMPYQGHGLEMDAFSLQEYLPSAAGGKHL